MALQLKPLQPVAAEASGVDISRPLDAQQVRDIEQAMDAHAVLVFRNQPLDQHQQIAFARSFGPLDLGLRKLKGGPHRFEYAELADISNVKADGDVADREHAKIVGNVANQLWHGDSSFSARAPSTRCCLTRWCRASVARPSSPTCAWPTTRCRPG